MKNAKLTGPEWRPSNVVVIQSERPRPTPEEAAVIEKYVMAYWACPVCGSAVKLIHENGVPVFKHGPHKTCQHRPEEQT